MQITQQDAAVGQRPPTVSRNTSLGREFYRSATWEEGTTTIKVTAIAFVSGIRARKNADGSVDLLDQVTRFNVMGKDEHVQYVERAMFLWDRTRVYEDGVVFDKDVDYSNEVGLYYPQSLEEAEASCELFITNLDFEENFDPLAWQ